MRRARPLRVPRSRVLFFDPGTGTVSPASNETPPVQTGRPARATADARAVRSSRAAKAGSRPSSHANPPRPELVGQGAALARAFLARFETHDE